MVSLFQKLSFTKSSPQPARKNILILKIRSEQPEAIKQIVDSEVSHNQEVKEDAFLSDKTRAFDRQTKAKVVDSFQAGKSSEGKKKQKNNLNLSDLGLLAREDPLKTSAQDYSYKKNAQKSYEQGGKISSTSDYLNEIPPADLTNLNTFEYKYYGFYHRIRQKLEQFWGKSLHQTALEIVEQGRRFPASEEYITALRITLDERGEIIGIEILGSSGIQELDNAAIESFNEAGPFPNPPQDLIVNGKITLEWGFIVQS